MDTQFDCSMMNHKFAAEILMHLMVKNCGMSWHTYWLYEVLKNCKDIATMYYHFRNAVRGYDDEKREEEM